MKKLLTTRPTRLVKLASSKDETLQAGKPPGPRLSTCQLRVTRSTSMPSMTLRSPRHLKKTNHSHARLRRLVLISKLTASARKSLQTSWIVSGLRTPYVSNKNCCHVSPSKLNRGSRAPIGPIAKTRTEMLFQSRSSTWSRSRCRDRGRGGRAGK